MHFKSWRLKNTSKSTGFEPWSGQRYFHRSISERWASRWERI